MKKLFAEFKKFISRGNVVDMAVGVAVAGAFTKIVTAFTTGFITPLLALLSNDADLTEFKWVLREAVVEVVDGVETVVQAEVSLMWGAFLQTIIDFLIIAGALFLVMKAFNAAADRAKKMREDLQAGLTPDRIKAEEEAKAKAEAEKKAAEEAAAKAEAEAEAAKAAEEKAAQKKAYAAQVEGTEMTAKLRTEIRDLLKEKN